MSRGRVNRGSTIARLPWHESHRPQCPPHAVKCAVSRRNLTVDSHRQEKTRIASLDAGFVYFAR